MKSLAQHIKTYFKEIIKMFEDILKIEFKVQKIYDDDYVKLFTETKDLSKINMTSGEQNEEIFNINATNFEKTK